jgi:hypothetical protein
VTIGLVAERFPKGGALTINAVAGVGMLGVGIVGSQMLGIWQDRGIDKNLFKQDETAHVRLMNPKEKMSIFGAYKALDQSKVNEVNDKTALYDFTTGPGKGKSQDELNKDRSYQTLVRSAYSRHVGETGDKKVGEMHTALVEKGLIIQEADYEALNNDRKLLGATTTAAKRDAMQTVAILPLMMALCYLGLMLYFRSKGGYKQVELAAGEGAAAEAKAEAQA